jgi:hypothetical protein
MERVRAGTGDKRGGAYVTLNDARLLDVEESEADVDASFSTVC